MNQQLTKIEQTIDKGSQLIKELKELFETAEVGLSQDGKLILLRTGA